MVARVLFPWLPPPLKKAFSLAVANVSSWVAPLKTVIFMPGGVFPTLSMPACLNQGGEGKKDGCEQGRLGHQSQRSLLSGSSLPFIKKYVLVRR